MKKKNNKVYLAGILLATLSIPNIALSLPAGEDKIHVQTSTPKKNDETAFSYMVSWRRGGDVTHRANGLTFIHGPDRKNATTDVQVAEKLAKALKDAMSYESPHFRGATAKATKGKPELQISNKDGFDFTHVTFRDYSNQKLSFDIPGKNFKPASVGIAIDLVYAAAVEYMEGLSVGKPLKTNGGYVRVTIDNGQPIEVKTDNKTTEEIEAELAKALGAIASYSSKPIYPSYTEPASRNYKPFDGGEVQLLGLDAKSITIDVNDSGLGLLAKFDFPDIHKPADVAGKAPYLVGFLLVCLFGYMFYNSRIKGKKKPDTEA